MSLYDNKAEETYYSKKIAEPHDHPDERAYTVRSGAFLVSLGAVGVDHLPAPPAVARLLPADCRISCALASCAVKVLVHKKK
jgi:hypothetical protein